MVNLCLSVTVHLINRHLFPEHCFNERIKLLLDLVVALKLFIRSNIKNNTSSLMDNLNFVCSVIVHSDLYVRYAQFLHPQISSPIVQLLRRYP